MGWLVGLDLGQASDFTAISVLETSLGKPPEGERRQPVFYSLRYLERPALGTSYPDIVRRVGELIALPDLAGARLVVDATSVGRAVVDLLRDARFCPVCVTITGGDSATRDERGGWRVPKRDLAGVLQTAFQTGRLKIASALDLAPVFVRELQAFKVKVTVLGHDSYEALREGDHDDLVLSVALAVWYGERYGGSVQDDKPDVLTIERRMKEARFAEVRRMNATRRW